MSTDKMSTMVRALETIAHSMKQALVLGNDWKREILLSKEAAEQALGQVKGEYFGIPLDDGTVRVPKFQIGDSVKKISGANWSGVVVGTYSSSLTVEGYAVESMYESGSVQIYPAAALERLEGQGK